MPPSASHPITIAPNARRVLVLHAGKTVADSSRALTLRETSYPPVQYLPREDVDMTLLHRTEKRTTCPHKGEASYFTIRTAAGEAADAAWSYETPKAAVADIAGHIAFYPDRVTIEEHAASEGP